MSPAPTVITVPGPVAQDKDLARRLRQSKLLPALQDGKLVVLDFSGVTTATQSFLHACLSEALRTHGEETLDAVQFRGCNNDVQQLIATVVEYSLRARTLTQAGLSGKLRKTDVPQADNLEMVRAVVDALAAGSATPEDVAKVTGFSPRHVHYRLHAARVMGFVLFVRNLASLTERGRLLVATEPNSQAERDIIIAGIRDSPLLQKISPTLLERKPPSQRELARRIAQKTGLSSATAERRARALLSWRRSLLDVQEVLPGIGEARRGRASSGARRSGAARRRDARVRRSTARH